MNGNELVKEIVHPATEPQRKREDDGQETEQ